MRLSEELTWRGFVNQTTYKDLSILDGDPITFYWGVDPSADSMTIGHLSVAMMAKQLIKHGHKAILLVGGATGLIGDPDGKASERTLLSFDQIVTNKEKITEQYKAIFAGQDFEVVDNYDWFKGLEYLSFLRDVGKNVPMRQMLGRDFVQSRLGEDGAGISYAEFSYSLIQGYDFVHLFKEKAASLQICGADQWGNSITGVDLIRRITGKEAHVLSSPLLVNKATGVKFGKTEAGAIWLDPNKTSPYQFYQFWLNVDDDSVEQYLKIFTDFDESQLRQLMDEFRAGPGQRKAQKSLAYEVTRLIHGEAAAETQKTIAAVLFGGEDAHELGVEEFEALKKELPVVRVSAKMDLEQMIRVLVESGLASSRTEARRFIESGAIYINNQKMPESFLFDSLSGNALIRRGKNNFAIVELG